jgi:hypothetical protein
MIRFNCFPVITVLLLPSLPALEAAGHPRRPRARPSHSLQRSSCSAHGRRYGSFY